MYGCGARMGVCGAVDLGIVGRGCCHGVVAGLEAAQAVALFGRVAARCVCRDA